MIEADAYCADIAQQVNASIGLLKSANMDLLEHHLMCCGVKNLSSQNPKKVENFVKELLKVRDVSTRK
jgi:DNA-binding FrmR family transcriptional regulator